MKSYFDPVLLLTQVIIIVESSSSHFFLTYFCSSIFGLTTIPDYPLEFQLLSSICSLLYKYPCDVILKFAFLVAEALSIVLYFGLINFELD